jgi:FKBP-type peptidyl-prolyl cis-trans isomerase SlyD
MNIKNNTVVTVDYHLTASINGEDEQLVEKTTPERPFVFLYGSGHVLPDFEKNLDGKKAGDSFDFKIAADKGYGNPEEEYIVNISREAFMVDGQFDDARVKVGNELEMNDAEGNVLVGIVTEVSDETVTMDFNHPLAGHDLHFVGKVIEVRPATPEEMEHGHVHGPGGHHH